MLYYLTHGLFFYIAGIILAAAIGVFFVFRRLKALEDARKKNLSKGTESTFDVRFNKKIGRGKLKEQRLHSLESRFSITRRAVLVLIAGTALIAVLTPVIGTYSPTLISVIVACVSVIIGIAARPFIENMICGLVLCFGKLAKIGDIVLVDGEYGTIEDVTLTHCILRRWDWLRYVVPNSLMMSKEFVNYSLRDNYRWVYVEFWIDNSQDLELVEEIAKDSPTGSSYFSGSETPRFWITELTPQAAKCMVVAWATTAADGWMLSIDIRKKLLKDLHKHGIKTHLQNINIEEKQNEFKTGEGN
jgi:small-conductance mechanosensitive channel